jgi:hypothetical protein
MFVVHKWLTKSLVVVDYGDRIEKNGEIVMEQKIKVV